MARPSERCPWHRDDTASLKLMPNGWYCFGCRKRPTHVEVEEALSKRIEYEEENEEPEDLTDKFGYIKSLEKRKIRGLEFPSDERGYYLCWPGDAYYKYRLYNPGKTGKYLSPRGWKPPMLWARSAGSKALIIAEGEINAFSLAVSFSECDVCSPGSASNFNPDFLHKYLTRFKDYSNVLVILDDDAAGTKALIEAKAFLLYRVPFIEYIQMFPDPNEVLNEIGPSGLRAKVKAQLSRPDIW